MATPHAPPPDRTSSPLRPLPNFINAGHISDKVLIAQTVIHIAFLLSAIAIAYTDKLLNAAHDGGPQQRA